MLVKVHTAEDRKVIAISDKELIGKEFSEKDRYLNVSEFFYNGEEAFEIKPSSKEEKKVLELLNSVSSINIVGEESIKFCIKNKLIEKENVLKVQKVPYAIVVLNDE